GLVDVLPIDADDGVAWARNEGVSVLAPIEGWTLAVGRDLLTGTDDDLGRLSRRLGTVVQVFHNDAVRGWAWAERGQVRRSARYDLGRDPTWLVTGERIDDEPEVDGAPTEGDVLSAADGWSIDPTRLPALRDVPATWGRLPPT